MYKKLLAAWACVAVASFTTVAQSIPGDLLAASSYRLSTSFGAWQPTFLVPLGSDRLLCVYAESLHVAAYDPRFNDKIGRINLECRNLDGSLAWQYELEREGVNLTAKEILVTPQNEVLLAVTIEHPDTEPFGRYLKHGSILVSLTDQGVVNWIYDPVPGPRFWTISDVALFANGDMMVVGTEPANPWESLWTVDPEKSTKAYAVRIGRNGMLGPSFRPPWLLETTFESVAIRQDGRIALLGEEPDGFVLWHVNEDLSLRWYRPLHFTPLADHMIVVDAGEVAFDRAGRTFYSGFYASHYDGIYNFPRSLIWVYDDSGGLVRTLGSGLTVRRLEPADLYLDADDRFFAHFWGTSMQGDGNHRIVSYDALTLGELWSRKMYSYSPRPNALDSHGNELFLSTQAMFGGDIALLDRDTGVTVGLCEESLAVNSGARIGDRFFALASSGYPYALDLVELVRAQFCPPVAVSIAGGQIDAGNLGSLNLTSPYLRIRHHMQTDEELTADFDFACPATNSSRLRVEWQWYLSAVQKRVQLQVLAVKSQQWVDVGTIIGTDGIMTIDVPESDLYVGSNGTIRMRMTVKQTDTSNSGPSISVTIPRLTVNAVN